MANPPAGKTALDIICQSLRSIGVLGSGEVPSGEESQDALQSLADMLDLWRADGLMTFTTEIHDFPLNPPKQTYTLGAGGDFDMIRPAQLDRASIIILSNVDQPLEYVIPIYTTQDWQEKVPIKQVPANWPLLVYDDGAFPLRSLSFWPVPTDSTIKFRLYSWQPLSDFADLNTATAFPPAYAEAIRWNLALRLVPEFLGPAAQAPVLIAQMAQSSLAQVKLSNLDDTQLRSDLRGAYTSSKMRAELFNLP